MMVALLCLWFSGHREETEQRCHVLLTAKNRNVRFDVQYRLLVKRYTESEEKRSL